MDDITKPPRWLLLSLLLLLFFQLGAAYSALDIPSEAADTLSLSPSIQFVTGVTWVVLFSWGIIKLLRRARHGIKYSLWIIAIFIVYSLVRLVIFTDAEYDRQRIPFLLVLFLFIIIIGVVVRLLWVKTHATQHNGEKTYDG